MMSHQSQKREPKKTNHSKKFGSNGCRPCSCGKAWQRVSSKEKEELKKKFGKSKQLLDGAYTELKRAQEAALKSIRGKRKSLDEFLKSKESQPQYPATSADVETDIINTDSEV